MGKGIVRGIGTGPTDNGTKGTLIISDPSGGAAGDGAVAVAFKIGQEVSFTGPLGINAGDLVEFSPDDTGNAVTVSKAINKGTVISGTQDGKVDCSGTNAVLIVNGTVTGKITANKGTLMITGNSVIDGKVDIDGGSNIYVTSGVKIGGKVDSTGGNRLDIQGATIDSKLVSNGDAFITLKNCVIEGKVEILSVGEGCDVGNNTVNGQIKNDRTCTPY